MKTKFNDFSFKYCLRKMEKITFQMRIINKNRIENLTTTLHKIDANQTRSIEALISDEHLRFNELGAEMKLENKLNKCKRIFFILKRRK